jgi:uncharacterized cupin superfamily protein
VLAHWDDVETHRRDHGHLRGEWTNLGRAAGSVGVGVHLIRVAPGEIPTPEHVHPVEEEIFYILEGSGLSRQDGKTYEIRAGDCIVHVAAAEAHTLRAGDDGLVALAFGHRMRTPGAYLPNANRYWLYPTWTEVAQEPQPYEAEPELEWPEPSPRPPNIVNVDEIDREGGRELAGTAGSMRSGLNWIHLDPGRRGPPPHCHSAEEEIFVVLDGDGILELWPTPGTQRLHPGFEFQEHPLRLGHVVSRPPGTRIAHSLRAGELGLTYLAYGTREPNDVSYYPRSNKIFWRGVGLIARVEPLDYDDGEPED